MPLRPRLITFATFSCALVSGFIISPHSARAALTFNFAPQAGTSQQAINGFTEAGNLWSSFLTDNVTINIAIGFTALGPGTLADAAPEQVVYSYDEIRTALTADSTSTLDATAVSNLQTGSALQFLTNTASGTVVLDNDTFSNTQNDPGANNTFLAVNRANAKALNLITANDGGVDGTIRFSSSFTYDFDRSDGIDLNSFDFVGLAAHEIGHALGFISGVDTVDYYSGPNTGPDGMLDLNPYAVFNTLDLFRYSSSSPNAVAGFPVQDLTQGTASYFSVDRGATNIGLFSTGPFDGDGRQASHWKDDQGLGLLDPTAATGERLEFTETDLRAFDAIGWNRVGIAAVPEPSTAGLLGFGFLTGAGLLLRRRK